VIKVAVFHSGGHTETGGLLEFLRKLDPHVEWERRFPALKPSPKLGLEAPAPAPADSGVTGDDLVDRVIERLTNHPLDRDCQCVLLVDDADCRFRPGDPPSFDDWCKDVKQRVVQAVGRNVRVHLLLAAPEIEAWLVSDWSQSFELEYREIDVALRRHIRTCCLRSDGLDWEAVEAYGGRRVNGTCERKLSDDLRDGVQAGGACPECAPPDAPELPRTPFRYSKRVHGARMLARVRPEQVRKQCSQLFAPAWQALRADLGAQR
jgi:hypothetical protein